MLIMRRSTAILCRIPSLLGILAENNVIPPSSRINRLPRFPFSRSFGAFARSPVFYFTLMARSSFFRFGNEGTGIRDDPLPPPPRPRSIHPGRDSFRGQLVPVSRFHVPVKRFFERSAAFNDFDGKSNGLRDW